jgi:hypothetical protein
MSDFTKEELKTILEWSQYLSTEHGTEGDEEERALDLKIKRIIDNYCEHEYITFLQDQNNEPFIEKCMECHALRICNDNQ